MTTWIIEVGTDPETAHEAYVGEAGSNFYGPMTLAQAEQYRHGIEVEWGKVSHREAGAFIYGTPFVKLHLLRMPIEAPGYPALPVAERMAGNWYLFAEARAELGIE
jgi:hypothetical protein